MFFLAVLTWATLTTEPPRIVKVYATLEACLIVAQKQNTTAYGNVPAGKFICLEAKGDT